MPRHGEDSGDGDRMDPLLTYGHVLLSELESKRSLTSKSAHWMARLFEQKEANGSAEPVKDQLARVMPS